jgi:D-3-phosphoglycerate dehydrogenase / 2-oxoglutarate reductase
MKVLVTDAEYSSLDIEAEVLTAGGHELVRASCRTPEEVIEAGAGIDAFLVQYAPITAEVLEGAAAAETGEPVRRRG